MDLKKQAMAMDKVKKQIDDILAMIEQEEIRGKILDFFMKDVNEYSQRLNMLSQKIKANENPPAVINKRFFLFLNEIIQKAEELEKVVDQKLLKKIKNAFRMSLIEGPLYKSLFIKRAYDKPQGYHGDYQIIESFYNNQPVSTGIGFCGDSYILNDNYVRAVRERKDHMKEILSDVIKHSKLSSMNILNIGCGPCREIRELFLSNFNIKKELFFTLVDQDKDALSFSQNAFKHISERIPKNIKINFIKETVFNLFNNKNTLEKQDIIYSIGLADYLPDAYLGRLIKFCFALLKPQGRLIIAHKNIKKYKATAPDWFCDWSFFPRNKGDLVDIVKTYLNTLNYGVRFRQENSKYIFFVVINKL
jgi:SAM-dependent methyltransferase